MATESFRQRALPPDIAELNNLVLDLFWTWSHSGDRVWRRLDPEVWEKTRNPWIVLQGLSGKRLIEIAGDAEFRKELDQLVAERREHLGSKGWYDQAHPKSRLKQAAYFTMEFGIDEALPLYAGGLGILAGDFLKATSDLGVPILGVGLLFQEGYFRQSINRMGEQEEVYPYNEPASMPIRPVESADGTQLRVAIDLPGRPVFLRVWFALIGRTKLYLLDSNDPLNSPVDRGITAKLYGGSPETRFLQEIVLGIGGWRALKADGLDIDICHINEGHAAFVILERARDFAERNDVSFREALWATRVGNVFTTHTPVPAGFDAFDVSLLKRFLPSALGLEDDPALLLETLLPLGQREGQDAQSAFNMAYLALRGSGHCNAVSKLHAKVSRDLFKPLFPRHPAVEIPVTAITNAIHTPTWDSAASDDLWTRHCGKDRWREQGIDLSEKISCAKDEDLWALRGFQRAELIEFLQNCSALRLAHQDMPADGPGSCARKFGPNTLTLGLARRFTDYKRPTLLLQDPDRLRRILTNPERPVQIVVAGKAHPEDEAGKTMVRDWVEFANLKDVRDHVAFIPDYDMAVASILTQGVDVWLNTPRRGWEACGTSGMKVLANGGLNLSELDGWWAEAYSKDVGWALGGDEALGLTRSCNHDDLAASKLYEMLENEVIPCFYERDQQGLPQRWLHMIRTSMARLAPAFDSGRMVQEYVEQIYHPAALAYRERAGEGGQIAGQLLKWEESLLQNWHQVHFGPMQAMQEDGAWLVTIPVYLGGIDPHDVAVELFAEAAADDTPRKAQLTRGDDIPGSMNGFVYTGRVPSARPIADYTARIIPYHPEAVLPIELPLVHWHD